MIASRITHDSIQTTGRASQTAIGTVQRRPVSAPATTIDRRQRDPRVEQLAAARAAAQERVPVEPGRRREQEGRQRDRAAVVARAMASGRHSRRTREPQEPDPRGDLRQEVEGPQGGPAEAQDDGGCDEQVDLAHEQLVRPRQEQDQQRPRPRPNEPVQDDDRGDRPEHEERLERQDVERREELGERRRIEVGRVLADTRSSRTGCARSTRQYARASMPTNVQGWIPWTTKYTSARSRPTRISASRRSRVRLRCTDAPSGGSRSSGACHRRTVTGA